MDVPEHDDEQIDDECYACHGTGYGRTLTGLCAVCKGTGVLGPDDFGDRADYEYDKWRDEQMEKDHATRPAKLRTTRNQANRS